MALLFLLQSHSRPYLCGVGLSVGPRGLHVGVNRRGMYTSAGIPGSGLYAIHYSRRPDVPQC